MSELVENGPLRVKSIKPFQCLIVALFCLNLVLLTGCAATPKQNTSITINATLKALASRRPIPISSSFIGMNIEFTTVCSLLSMDQLHRQAFEHLFTSLGVGILHIGGHSADEATWHPGGHYVCKKHTVVTRSLVHAIFDFARRIHWTVIWGLNFLGNNPQMDANEASDVAAVGGSSLLGFTIGNEPEDYAKHGYRPTGWTYQNFLSEWRTDRAAVATSVPGAHFIGPEACCQPGWYPSFLQDEHESDMVSAYSHHFYYYSGRYADDAHVNASTFLAPKAMQRFIHQTRHWVLTAQQSGLPIDITEMNSVSNGGIRGVSDTFATSLWVSDMVFQAATQGINQIDFQEVPEAPYALINSQGDPQAIYNGLLFSSLALSSSTIVPSRLHSSANLSAYVLHGSDGSLRVVLINKTAQQNALVTFTPGVSYHAMTTVRMQAPAITASTGIAIGNTTNAAEQSLNVLTLPQTRLNAAVTTLDVAAHSAALFTFLP